VKRGLVALLGTLALVPACGGTSPIGHPAGADELVLRVETGGGLVPPEYRLRELPGFSLYGDGHLIVTGPQIEIYPPPALPSLLVRHVTEEGVQAVLAAARDAGLLGPDRRLEAPGVMDAPTTVFTAVEDGRRHVTSADALGIDVAGIPEPEARAREALAGFATRLAGPGGWLPPGSLGEERPYGFRELRVHVFPYEASPEPELTQAETPWPLAEPLASFGEPSANAPGRRCGVARGAELAALLSRARTSNQLTPWTSGGRRYLLVLRPLLPDEHGC
jgi:hypothetical protein